MVTKMWLSLMLLVVFSSSARAQGERGDSLVTHFLERGILSGWSPARLFAGCPNLEEWQERGIRRLLAASVTNERVNDLARSWSHPLQNCNDPRLEDWFATQLDAAIARGEWGHMLALRTAIYEADTPRLREYLRNQMLDSRLPEAARSTAGVFYFMRFEPEEFLREFLSAFETMRMPDRVAWGQTDRLLDRKPDRLLMEVGRLVRGNPGLADQTAFTQIVESSRGRATEAARRSLGSALREGLDRAGGSISGRRRDRLEAAAQFLTSSGG
jgi:hypothetical protein